MSVIPNKIYTQVKKTTQSPDRWVLWPNQPTLFFIFYKVWIKKHLTSLLLSIQRKNTTCPFEHLHSPTHFYNTPPAPQGVGVKSTLGHQGPRKMGLKLPLVSGGKPAPWVVSFSQLALLQGVSGQPGLTQGYITDRQRLDQHQNLPSLSSTTSCVFLRI